MNHLRVHYEPFRFAACIYSFQFQSMIKFVFVLFCREKTLLSRVQGEELHVPVM